jgi:UPF0755 protein
MKNRLKGLRLWFAVSVMVVTICLFLKGERVEKIVVIPKGATLYQIAEELERADIIWSRWVFMALAKVLSAEKRMIAGEYRFCTNSSLFSVLNALKEGRVVLHRFTIPEGWRLKDIAQYFEDMRFLSRDRFLALCHNQDFIKELGILADSAEGYLFPDTYRFARGVSEEEVIKTMVKRCMEVLSELEADDVHKVLTLASIIEKEAKLAEEKPIISSVFHNRLKRGLPLQSCATVLYALGKHKQRLSHKDLETDSEYNTYIHPGLPPGPICSPGADSIKACLNPADTDYLYFVVKEDVRHHFAKTLKEHITAKR